MRLFMVFTALAALFCGTLSAQTGTITIGGVARNYIVYAPSGLSGNPPLVFSVHGMNQTNTWMRSASGWDKIADTAKEKFVVVYPQSNGNTWDLSAGGNDVKFFLALIDTMAARFNIDRGKVFETGFSMGGMMSYALTCAAADKFAAVAPCSGYLLGGAGTCATKRPMPIYHMHGAADDFVAYANLKSFLNTFITKFNCPKTAQVTNSYNSNSKLTKEYWGPCDQGSEITLISISGLGHAYTTGPDINETLEAWAFFKKHMNAVETDRIHTLTPEPHSISAKYLSGVMHLQSVQPFDGIDFFNIQGKMIFAWKAAAAPVRSITFPVTLSAGGIYVLHVSGVETEAIQRIVIR